jgi:hypothetical protein
MLTIRTESRESSDILADRFSTRDCSTNWQDFGYSMLVSRRGTDRKRTGVRVKVQVILRPTVSRPVCLGVRHSSGTRDQVFFLLEIFFRQLRL